MSWLFSRALAEEYLAENFSVGEQCALWSGTHMQRASWLPAKTTKHCLLSQMGYDSRWCIMGADDVGAPHKRKRIWLLAYPMSAGERWEPRQGKNETDVVAYPNGAQRERNGFASRSGQAHAFIDASSTWWGHDPAEAPEPRLGRMAHGVANRVDRLKAIGNGQVPIVAATAFRYLSKGLL